MRITSTLLGDQCTFLKISHSFLLRMRNVPDKNCTENQNTHFTLNTIFKKLCHLWDNMEKQCRASRPQMTIRHMLIACWITKATGTHSEYVILTDFILQKWLHECAWMLCCVYNACLVSLSHSLAFLPFWIMIHLKNCLLI
jgi:hypothetical protein